jgi:hypothetical protein
MAMMTSRTLQQDKAILGNEKVTFGNVKSDKTG